VDCWLAGWNQSAQRKPCLSRSWPTRTSHGLPWDWSRISSEVRWRYSILSESLVTTSQRGGNSLHIWRVYENKMNKLSGTADKGWSLNLGSWRGYKMDAVCTPETLVPVSVFTWHCNPADQHWHLRRENVRSCHESHFPSHWSKLYDPEIKAIRLLYEWCREIISKTTVPCITELIQINLTLYLIVLYKHLFKVAK
jgi:hypothetical protein